MRLLGQSQNRRKAVFVLEGTGEKSESCQFYGNAVERKQV